MNPRVVAAILKKDVRSLPWLVSLVALLFLCDPIVVRLDSWPVWSLYGAPVVLTVLVVLVTLVFQLDSAASLTADWLCRPVPARELVAAKLLLVAAIAYLPRAIGTLVIDLWLGAPLSESLLDALLLQDQPAVFLLPIFVFVAIITRTFVQTFGVLFGLFVAVFMLPTPFVRPPGPLSPGIREALLVSGLHWLAMTPAQIVSLLLLAVGIWLVYWRRRLLAARVLMAVTVLVMLFLFVLPMALVPFDTAFAVQAAVSPAAPEAAGRITLRNTKSCFPAVRRTASSSDPLFRDWEEESLRTAGPGSVAFMTAIEPRRVPVDWRALPHYVQADYLDGDRTLFSLRPAHYTSTSAGADVLTSSWLLPESALHRLRGADAKLRLTYSMTLVRPQEYRLPTDGSHHHLNGLGWCSAAPDQLGGHIDVGCFIAGARPVQISAQLDDIPASSAFSRPDFTPPFAAWPYGERSKLTIAAARLARHDTITVIAWRAAGQIQKSLTLPGILGGDAGTCPLPEGERAAYPASSWRDAAPHEVRSIGVDDGVQLEVLDFGGAGAPIVLLPGLGATAHSFDDLAPQLARHHRVVALTRRGAGNSTRPDFGFDTPRLGLDVLRVMDAMQLDHVLLVGHSIAGDELTWLGGHHAARFRGLVYLDAAYDRSQKSTQLRELYAELPPEPPIPPAAFASYEAMSALLERRGHLRMPEGELIAFWQADNPARAGTPAVDARSQQAITAALEPPDYAALKLPALAIYAIADADERLPPWYDPNDAALQATLAEIRRVRDEKQRRDIQAFRENVAHGEVLELPGAEHYIIQSNPQEVLDAIERFDR